MSASSLRFLALAATLVGGATQAQTTLALLCQGSGSVLRSKVSNGIEYDNRTRGYDRSTSTTTTDRQPFSGAANVEIAGSAVRVRLPHELVPPLNRSHDGWFAVDESFVGEKQITGTLALNAFNKQKLTIDRMTGQLVLSGGFGDFNGACSKVDEAAGPKF